MIKVLIVDETSERAMRILGKLGEGKVQATLITHVDKAKINLVNVEYDVIMLGDKIKGGDTYDVALAMKSSRRNVKTSVLCIGRHTPRATRLAGLLGAHRALVVNTNFQKEIDIAVGRLSDYLTKKFEK
jgi:DNA-binding response OmpR family regulator